MRATSDTVLVSPKKHRMPWKIIGNTKPPGTQKLSKAPISAETPVFTGFQAQKKTSVDVFR